MISSHDWATWLTYLLAAFFCINGVVNVIGPKVMRDSFAAWGYPSWFHITNGVIQLTAGVLLLSDATRVVGLALGVLVCIGVFATLIRFRQFAHLPPGVILCALLLIDLWGLTSWPLHG
jgi:uncharacterized membrane protein HdeD (DUF308 family)